MSETKKNSKADSLKTRKKWDDRYSTEGGYAAKQHIAPFLESWLPALPVEGFALDLAAGAGRHSIALARHGLRMRAIDISGRGLAWLKQRAAPHLMITPVVMDLQRGWLPPEQYQVIVNFFYLERAVWPAVKTRLAPGGWFIMETFTRAQANLFKHKKIQEDFLLQPDELRAAFADLRILHYSEGLHKGKYTARLVARA